MPTTRARHQVTETPAVAHAIDAAARRWPEESRSKLLLRLVEAGAAVIDEDRRTVARERRAAIEASSGKYPDAFGTSHLADLRRDWPD